MRPALWLSSTARTAVARLQAGYQFDARWRLVVDIFYLFNQRANDITYFYTSRLPGEPLAGVNDIHFHPVEPIGFRGYVNLAW